MSNRSSSVILSGCVLVSCMLPKFADAHTNSWISNVDGDWHDTNHWSLGIAPSSGQSEILITNTQSKTVSITPSTPLNTLTISNLTIAGSIGTNKLLLNNAGAGLPLQIENRFVLKSGGALLVSNSVLRVSGSGNNPIIDGTVTLSSGSVISTNASMIIGDNENGSMYLNGGTWQANHIVLGGSDTGIGLLNVNGGKLDLPGDVSDIIIGQSGLGKMIVNKGKVEVADDIFVGFSSIGEITVSNGLVDVGGDISLGVNSGSSGTLTVTGGSVELSKATNGGQLNIGRNFGSRGTVWVTGGSLILTNTSSDIFVGNSGTGDLTVSNGSLRIGGNIDEGIINNNQLVIARNSFSQGTVTLAGGTMHLSGDFVVANAFGSTGTVWITGGALTMPNGNDEMFVGNAGAGSIEITNGVMQVAGSSFVGNESRSTGKLIVRGGNLDLGDLFVGNKVDSTGTVWVTGGQIALTNSNDSNFFLGNFGVGQMTVDSGQVQIGGSLIAGNSVSNVVNGSGNTNIVKSVGTLAVDGGSLLLTNTTSDLIVGNFGFGGMAVSNGSVQVGRDLVIGSGFGSSGTATISGGGTVVAQLGFVAKEAGSIGAMIFSGGVSDFYETFIIGATNCSSTGSVTMTAGNIAVTNASSSAVLDVRSGSLTIGGGLLRVDSIILTNDCAQFVRTGGELIYETAVIPESGDTDGDGLPNDWELSFEFDPLNPLGNDGADGDPDEDRFTNLEEFQGGSNPRDPADIPPTLRIIELAREGNDIQIIWETEGGTTNQPEVAFGVDGGQFVPDNFINLGPQMFILNSGLVTTNVVDPSGATNSNSRFYRIRLLK